MFLVHPDFADELDATWCTYAFLRYTSYGNPVAKLGYYEPLKGEYDKCNRTYGYICQYEPIPVAECAALEIPDNGYINASDNRTVGSVATLGCNPGYIDVNGQDTVSRTCLKSGLWSGRSPDCKDFRPVETTTTPIPTTSTTMPLFQPHKGANESSCAKDTYGGKPVFYLECKHGEMIKVTNATLHPERTSKSCDVENTPDCTHNFTEIAAAYCEYKEICRMPIQMQSYITTNKGNCCEEIWCHEIDYFCVEAMCREPPSPLNGNVVRKTVQPGKNERFNSWDRNGLATYTCDNNFELVGQDIRTCDRSITYHYGPPEFVFKWNGVAPMCNIRRNLCPSTSNKMEVHGHMCYEFFERQNTTHDQAQTACEVKKGWSIAVVSNPEVLNIIRNHLNLQIRSSQKYWVKVHQDIAAELDATWCTYAFLQYDHYGRPEGKLGYYAPLAGDSDKCNLPYGYICQFEPVPVTECVVLEIPENGYINVSSQAIGSVAILGCNPGYMDVTHRETLSRSCLQSGFWSGRSPDCIDSQVTTSPTLQTPTTESQTKPVPNATNTTTTPFVLKSPSPNIGALKEQNTGHSPESLGAGIGIGIGISAVVAAGIIVFLLYRRHSKTQKFNASQMNNEEPTFDNRVMQNDAGKALPMDTVVGTGDNTGVTEKDKKGQFSEKDWNNPFSSEV